MTRSTGMLAAAGGNPSTQLKLLKAHLEFQKQEHCNLAVVDWATTITRAQSRRHITAHLNRKINSKMPGFHTPGKLDTEEGQEALQTAARHVDMGLYYGGNGWHLLGWKIRYRMYRERSRRRSLSEESFWDILADVSHSPKLQPKEQSFPKHIQQRHSLRRAVSGLVRAQGANPRRHKNALLLQTHLCPMAGIHVTREDGDERGRCPHCQRQLDSSSLTARAFDPGDPPELIAPGVWKLQPSRPRQQQAVAGPPSPAANTAIRQRH